MWFSMDTTGRVIAGSAVLAAAVLMGGCSNVEYASNTAASGVNHADTTAASLRTTLDELLRESVVLTSAATDAALGNRPDEFNAAQAAVTANTQQLAAAIGSVYGKDAQDAFAPLWTKHIGLLIDYTQGVAANDDAKKSKAINDLIAYSDEFGAYLENLTGGKLQRPVVADLIKTHVTEMKTIIDDQANKNWGEAYNKERDAEAHMDTIGNALADVITQQYPDRF
jgi:hypothetical protein